VAKLFIHISKNGEKTQLFLLFSFFQKHWLGCENSPKNSNYHGWIVGGRK
jgi:hypothetical protein